MTAFNLRCAAAASTVTPGGTFVDGTYHLNRAYSGPLCTGLYAIGAAKLFKDINGNIIFQYAAYGKAAPGDVGTRHGGAYWFKPGANGTLERIELCDAARKGTSQQGTFLQAANELTLTFPGEQYRWEKE